MHEDNIQKGNELILEVLEERYIGENYEVGGCIDFCDGPDNSGKLPQYIFPLSKPGYSPVCEVVFSHEDLNDNSKERLKQMVSKQIESIL